MKYTPSSIDQTSSNSYLIDQLFVKGVRHNRDENDSNHDYIYVEMNENQGLRFYLHKYFIGFHPYYMQVENQKSQKKEEIPIEKIPVGDLLVEQDSQRDLFFRQRKDMLSRSLSLVMRSTFLVRDFGKLESITGPESLFDPSYSGNHIVILECQLKTPS